MNTASLKSVTVKQDHLNGQTGLRLEPAAKLQPKEHGAYAILGIPIATALILAGPTFAGIAVAVAAVAGFLAHEPLLVMLGRRGSRAQRTTPTARRRLFVLLAITLAAGTFALAAGSFVVGGSLLGCGLLAIGSFVLAVRGKHRTFAGQLAGVVSLSAVSVPILLAGDFSMSQTAETWGTWLIGFFATTVAVRGVIAAQKRHSRAIHWSALTALSSLVVGLTLAKFWLPIATLPMIAMCWYLMFDPPPAKQLKRVGWTLVVGTVASAIWMIAALDGML